MKKYYIVLILVFLSIASFPHITALRTSRNRVYGFTAVDQGVYNLSLSIYGNITNEGVEPVYVNETDLLIFDYPLNTSDQTIFSVKAWVNSVEYNYSLVGENDSVSLIIESPIMNETIDPGETVSAGVNYEISVDLGQRRESIADFYLTSDPYTLVDKAGGWNQLSNFSDKNLVNITRMWNYTHPLVRLVNEYLNRVVNPVNPLAHLLNVLSWFDDNIVYSTRIPPRYPWEVIVEGAGDCDDQSNLLITLLRSRGIPSYLEVGYVFVAQNFRFVDREANGYITVEFIGGGGHGWVSTYIPPWGWIRVDPIVAAGSNIDLSKVAIKFAYYYMQPTIVTGRVIRGDYVAASARGVEEIKTHKLRYHIVVEMRIEE